MEIEGYENYLIYNDGRVFNKKRKRFLKKSKDEYKKVCLYNGDGKPKDFRIHRLVAKYYCINENPEEYNIVDHIDRNPDNNHYTNLRWCNISVNMKNRGDFKSKTGYFNIYVSKELYQVCIKRNKIIYQKYFKTIEEAIKYRDELLSSFN